MGWVWIIPVLQMRNLRLRELKRLIRGRTMYMEQPDLSPDSVALQPCILLRPFAHFPHSFPRETPSL